MLESASAETVLRSSTEPSALTKHGMPSLATMLTLRTHRRTADMQQKSNHIGLLVIPIVMARCIEGGTSKSSHLAQLKSCRACCHPGPNMRLGRAAEKRKGEEARFVLYGPVP